MIVSVIVLILLGIVFVKRDRKSGPLLKAAGKKRRVPVAICEAGLTVEGLIRRLITRVGSGQVSGADRAKLMKSEAEVTAEKGNWFGLSYLLALIGALAGLFAGILTRNASAVTEIERPEFGAGTTVELVVEREGESQAVSVPVSGKKPRSEELDAVLDLAFREGKQLWLGKNENYEQIRTNLAFPNEDEKGIRYSFRSDSPEWLSDYGTILAEEIPEEGRPVRFTVTLQYETHEKTYELAVVLVPEVKERTSPLEDALMAADREGSAEETMKLPSEVDGEKVVFWEKTVSPITVLAVFLLIAGIVAFLPRSREQAELKKRKEELERGYSQMVSGLCTFIGAGLSIRTAWLRISEMYRAEVKTGIRPREYVYEEMVLSSNELMSGVSEEEVYVRFGRRMGLHRYLKLGNLLSQNIRQGISGLEAALRSETEEALEERKNLALKKGEEAGTKLLAPMMIMLGIVIVVLVIPAFMMF